MATTLVRVGNAVGPYRLRAKVVRGFGRGSKVPKSQHAILNKPTLVFFRYNSSSRCIHDVMMLFVFLHDGAGGVLVGWGWWWW